MYASYSTALSNCCFYYCPNFAKYINYLSWSLLLHILFPSDVCTDTVCRVPVWTRSSPFIHTVNNVHVHLLFFSDSIEQYSGNGRYRSNFHPPIQSSLSDRIVPSTRNIFSVYTLSHRYDMRGVQAFPPPYFVLNPVPSIVATR